jgi:predicted transglutaminase-like protease
MLFLKLNRGKLHDKKKSNIISIGDHIYPHDKTLSIPNLLDWTKKMSRIKPICPVDNF